MRCLRVGALGEVQAATMMVPWWRPQSYYDEPGRGVKARDGGGVLITQAIHTLDLFRWLVGIERSRRRRCARRRCTAWRPRTTRPPWFAWAMVRRARSWPPSRRIPAARSGSGDRLEGHRAAGWRQPAAGISRRQRGGADGQAGTGSGASVMAFSHEPHRAVHQRFPRRDRTGARSGDPGRGSAGDATCDRCNPGAQCVARQGAWNMQELLPLAEQLGARLKARGETIAIAESSTGGLISAALLSVAGASAYFRGGSVIYTHYARSGVSWTSPIRCQMACVHRPSPMRHCWLQRCAAGSARHGGWVRQARPGRPATDMAMLPGIPASDWRGRTFRVRSRWRRAARPRANMRVPNMAAARLDQARTGIPCLLKALRASGGGRLAARRASVRSLPPCVADLPLWDAAARLAAAGADRNTARDPACRCA